MLKVLRLAQGHIFSADNLPRLSLAMPSYYPAFWLNSQPNMRRTNIYSTCLDVCVFSKGNIIFKSINWLLSSFYVGSERCCICLIARVSVCRMGLLFLNEFH